MRLLIICAFVLAVAMLVAACGSGDDPELTVAAGTELDDVPAVLSPTVADIDDVLTPTVSDLGDAPLVFPSDLMDSLPRPLPPELAALDDLDLESILRRGCLAWSFLETRDHGAINDAVSHFLMVADTYGAGGSRMFTRAQLDRFAGDGVRAACAADSVEHAWGILTGVLDMSDEDFATLVDVSCQSYRLSEAQPAEFQPRNKTWDGFVLQVLGVDDLADLIDRMCGPAT